MRSVFAIFLALAVPAAGQMGGQQSDPDKNAQGGVQVPGWQARLDEPRQSLNDLHFRPMGPGMHITTGPAAILWRPGDTAKGNYQVTATFALSKLPEHQEAYGIFMGGTDLMGDGQRYSYFIIREDGKFMIRRRQGTQTPNIVDWTDHASVQKPGADGRLKNTLTVQVGSQNVRFLANGTEVSSQPRSALDTDGLVGLRINHNLDVHIDGFKIDKAAS